VDKLLKNSCIDGLTFLFLNMNSKKADLGGTMKEMRFETVDIFYGTHHNVRNFLGIFKARKKAHVRPGAMQPQDVKELISKIGKNKKVNIRRVEFDGTPEVKPVSVVIVDIRNEYFTGSIINVERSIKQEMDIKTVYIKGGGGTIDFYFNEGDIMSIEEDIDEKIITQRNSDELLEILEALDLNESVMVSYYDRGKGGVINGVGKLTSKDLDAKSFEVELNLINDIELDHPKRVNLNLDVDAVVDLEVVI